MTRLGRASLMRRPYAGDAPDFPLWKIPNKALSRSGSLGPAAAPPADDPGFQKFQVPWPVTVTVTGVTV
jgi:hypothetical protein